MLAPRPARRRCPGARRSPAGCGWSAPSAAISPRSRCSRACAGYHQVASTASVVCASACWPGRQRGDEERGVVAARLGLRGDPAGPGPQQVGPQRQLGVGQQLGPVCADGRPGRPGPRASQAGSMASAPAGAVASSTPHSSNVSRTAACTSAPASSGRAVQAPAPPARIRARSTGRGRARPRDRRRRRGTRSCRRRTPSRPPGVAGTPAAGGVRVRDRDGRGAAARSPPAAVRQAVAALVDSSPPTAPARELPARSALGASEDRWWVLCSTGSDHGAMGSPAPGG